MGMPVVVDVRDGELGGDAVDEVFAWLRFVDATFSTYRAGSEIRRLDSRRARARRRPSARARGARALRAPARRAPAATSTPAPPARSTPRRSSRAGRSTARRRCCRRRARAASASTRAATSSCAAGRGGSACSTRGSAHRIAAVLSLTDAAVATSGAYERGEHIVDPLTRRPAARRAVGHRARPRPRDRRRLRHGGVRDGRARARAGRARLRGCGAMTILAGDRVLLHRALPAATACPCASAAPPAERVNCAPGERARPT